MCARECLAGEQCRREEACRAADAKYLPLIRQRQREKTWARFEQLLMACHECVPEHFDACVTCDVPREMARVHAKLIRLMREGPA